MTGMAAMVWASAGIGVPVMTGLQAGSGIPAGPSIPAGTGIPAGQGTQGLTGIQGLTGMSSAIIIQGVMTSAAAAGGMLAMKTGLIGIADMGLECL